MVTDRLCQNKVSFQRWVLARNNVSVWNKALVWSKALAAGLQVAGADWNETDQSSKPFFSGIKVRRQTVSLAGLKFASSGVKHVVSG